MKILYLSDHGPYYNNFIRQDVNFINKKHSVRYFSFLSDQAYKGKEINTRLIQYPVNSLKSKILWRLENAQLYYNWYDRRFSKKLSNEIQAFNPDVIHCQFAYECIKFFDNIKIKTPVVINFRGNDASSKLMNKAYIKKIKNILSKKNTYSIFVSESLKNNLLSKGIKFANEPLVLYTGVKLKMFKRKNYKLSPNPVFLQIGSFTEKKGQIISLEAFETFVKKKKNSNAKLIFVGDGIMENFIKEKVRKKKLYKQVIFLGRLSQKKIIDQLEKATVYIHHAITAKNGDKEGVPNSIIEAMAMELPILSTFHSGIPEAVENNVNGLLSKEGDTIEFYKNMEKIINWKYVNQNRQKVREMFDFHNHIRHLENHYYKIIC